MASGSTVPRDSKTASQSPHRGIPSGYIESQLEKTSGEVRLVEISIAILTLCLIVLGYVLVLGVLEHWFFSSGLSVATRTLLLIGLLTVLVLYARRRLFPYVRYKISLAYAAHTIEQSEPRLKNSLLNFLFLRRQQKGVPDVVFRGLEQQAATGLSRVSLDLSIERKRLTQLGIALIAIILFGAVYTILSPKSLVPEVGRMLFPWADINAATRVTISDIEPGSQSVALRSDVQISAIVKGLRENEPVTLIFSSADGGAVDQQLPMDTGSVRDRYDRQITETNTGMVTDLTYHIEAGDAVSKEYQLEVMPAPSFQVKRVEYQYPPYTGLESRTVVGTGDLRAIEGTRVTIHAESTDEIAVATLQLQPEIDAEKSVSRRMNVIGNQASSQVTLRRRPIAGDSIPEYASYFLSLKTSSGETNPNQVRHQISILRDEPPLVDILMPQESTLEVREDDALTFEVRGRDPDFRLTELWLVGHQGNRERFKIDLLGRSKRAGEPLRAVHRKSTRFVPRDWNLKAGETVSVFAVAMDNKQPAANRTETSSVQVRILPPLPGSESSKSNASDDQNQDQESPPDTEQAESAESQQGQSGKAESEQEKGESGEQEGGDSGSDGTGNAAGQEQTQNGESNSESGGSTGASKTSAGENSEDGSSDAQSGQGKSEPQENPGGAESDSSQRGANSETNTPSSTESADNSNDPQGASQDSTSGSSQANQNASQAPGSDPRTPPSDQPPPEGSQTGEGSDAGETENSKVDNDGDAFEQLNEIIQQKSKGDGRSSENSSADPQSSQSKSTGSEQNQTTSRESPSDESSNSTPSSTPQKTSEQAQPEQDSGTNAAGQTAESDPERTRDGTGQRDRISDSSDSKDNSAEQAEQASDAGAEASRDENGGGTGNEGDQPPPPGEGLGQDRRKSGTSQQDSQQEEEPADGGVSERDSDSAQGEEGSRNGKGQEGGGQQSQQQGEGAAGANTPSDAGKGASGEPGQGESGSEQGSNPQSAQSEQPTGEPGTGSGEGSSQQSADAAAKDTREGTGGSASSTPSTKPDQGTPPGEGGGGVGSEEPENYNGLTEPGADAANLEYANQTTDLVLDYLEQQLDAGGVDEELKKRFGWTDRDFAEFVQRYRTMKNKTQLSGSDGAKAKTDWKNVLRSLGLTPPQRGDRTSATPANRTSGLRESGRSRPPQEDQDRFDAFRRDVLGR
ncbi:MAG: hypothetical protein VYA11_00055 [Planctomycetota bacterium]|nr:hypothetical protein [Planctomycetota bacterium]